MPEYSRHIFVFVTVPKHPKADAAWDQMQGEELHHCHIEKDTGGWTSDLSLAMLLLRLVSLLLLAAAAASAAALLLVLLIIKPTSAAADEAEGVMFAFSFFTLLPLLLACYSITLYLLLSSSCLSAPTSADSLSKATCTSRTPSSCLQHSNRGKTKLEQSSGVDILLLLTGVIYY